MKFYFLLFILLSSIVNAEEKCGPVILVGGGTIPQKAVDWMKEKSLNDKFVIVTCCLERDKKWKDFFNQPKFYLPENLKIEAIEDIGGLIIEGGDQWEYVNRLDGKIINEAHKKGMPILGTSAGAMILGSSYFSAEKGSITSEDAEKGECICIAKNFVYIKSLENTIIDTHFTKRNRKKRLEIFVQQSGVSRGIGIDEATALCIDEKGEYVIFGEGNVHFLNQ